MDVALVMIAAYWLAVSVLTTYDRWLARRALNRRREFYQMERDGLKITPRWELYKIGCWQGGELDGPDRRDIYTTIRPGQAVTIDGELLITASRVEVVALPEPAPDWRVVDRRTFEREYRGGQLVSEHPANPGSGRA